MAAGLMNGVSNFLSFKWKLKRKSASLRGVFRLSYLGLSSLFYAFPQLIHLISSDVLHRTHQVFVPEAAIEIFFIARCGWRCAEREFINGHFCSVYRLPRSRCKALSRVFATRRGTLNYVYIGVNEGQCCPRVAASPYRPNSPITQLSPSVWLVLGL